MGVCLCAVRVRSSDNTHTRTLTAETAMKARREIADYMKSGRIERARIRVSLPVTAAVSVPWYC